MDKTLKWKCLLLVSLTLSGCGIYKIDESVVPVPDVVVVVDADLTSKIKKSLEKAPKDDCIQIYTFFSGLSRFITNLKNDDITIDEILNKVLLNAQNNYGWNRERYPDFSTAISEDLNNRKLDEPHKLGDETAKEKIKDVLVKALDEYSAIVKSIVEHK